MFCPPLIYSKLGWKTCTFIPNKHHFRRWLISEITFFHQQFFRIKIDLICKTNIWTLPMRKTTSKLRGIKVLRSKSHGNYERFFKIRWLCVHGNSIRNPASRHICKNDMLEKFHAKSQSLCDGAGISSWVDNVFGYYVIFKGILSQNFFQRLSLIFWIVMGCGKAHFGRKSQKAS